MANISNAQFSMAAVMVSVANFWATVILGLSNDIRRLQRMYVDVQGNKSASSRPHSMSIVSQSGEEQVAGEYSKHYVTLKQIGEFKIM